MITPISSIYHSQNQNLKERGKRSKAVVIDDACNIKKEAIEELVNDSNERNEYSSEVRRNYI